MAQVSFDGGTFELEDVQENPAHFARRLERAKITPGFALCLCRSRGANLRLVIRRYRSPFLSLAGPTMVTGTRQSRPALSTRIQTDVRCQAIPKR
jgi:hypothetical protein